MPTGYTAYIEDGSITTGKEFLKLCTRAFGIAVEIRDEPLSVPTPTQFSPNAFYRNKYERAVAELDVARSMTIDTARAEMRARHEQDVARAREFVEKYTAINERYAGVREQVEAWLPPTEAHTGIKKFALEQIDMCVTDDKYLDEYRKRANAVLDDSDEAVAAYIQEQIAFCEESAQRAKAAWEEEQNRAKEKSDFMSQFISSLENME